MPPRPDADAQLVPRARGEDHGEPAAARRHEQGRHEQPPGRRPRAALQGHVGLGAVAAIPDRPSGLPAAGHRQRLHVLHPPPA